MSSTHEQPDVAPPDESVLIAARREKLKRWREELKIDPYGCRVDGLIPLADARALFDPAAHEAHKTATEAAKNDPSASVKDNRKRAMVAGRCVQHRLMGKLAFIVLRAHTGDLQISVSFHAKGLPRIG
jgi:lysyl-tRNA synthetase class II